MSGVSPRPWRIDRDGIYIRSINNNVVARLNADISNENTDHIIQCVNEHDVLVAERDRYRKMLLTLCDIGIVTGPYREETRRIINNEESV